MTTERPKVGMAAIIRKEGRILLGSRVSSHGAGTFAFPGGHLEYGEEFAEGILREIAEECGLTVTTPWLAAVTNDIFKEQKHYITLFLIADWVAGEPEALEPEKMAEWRWVRWEDFPENVMLPIQNLKKQGFHPFKASELAA